MASSRQISVLLLMALLAFLSASIVGGVSAGELTASWIDHSAADAAFAIDRRSQSDPTFTTLTDVPPGVTSYVDSSIVDGVTYCYRVKAFNASGESPYSEEVCAASTPTSPSSYSLTITKAGTGVGTVVSSPAGIVCGSDCAEAYTVGQTVVLVVTPATGSTFVGWSGRCSGTRPCVVTANRAVEVTATFNQRPNLSRSPGGTVRPPTLRLPRGHGR